VFANGFMTGILFLKVCPCSTLRRGLDLFDRNDFKVLFRAKLEALNNREVVKRARDWLSKNSAAIESLFRIGVVRDFVFEPIKDVFKVPGEGETANTRSIITQVAVVNAVIAGLPGSLGVGVYVSIALEFWMAFAISQAVGLSLTKDEAIKTVLVWAAGAGMILIGFKVVLNLLFPIVTALMPVAGFGTAATQLIVTNLFGVMFWVMFEEVRANRKFQFPMTSVKRLGQELTLLLKHQYQFAGKLFNLANLTIMGKRFIAWFSGDIDTDIPKLRGELAATAAMIALLQGNEQYFDSPLGTEFIQSIRDRYPDLADASIGEISAHMSQYAPEQMVGVISLIKGKLFERMVAHYENNDSDDWTAVLHTDEQYPGSDLIFENEVTGEIVEVSLKATDNLGYLESSLLKYPEFPIVSTDEVAGLFGDSSIVMKSGISNQEITQVTKENFNVLLDTVDRADALTVAGAGVGAYAFVTLWPFVVARIRNRIDAEQLETVCIKVLPETGKLLATRLSFALVFGPVYAWWLLARGVMLLSDSSIANPPIKRVMLLELKTPDE